MKKERMKGIEQARDKEKDDKERHWCCGEQRHLYTRECNVCVRYDFIGVRVRWKNSGWLSGKKGSQGGRWVCFGLHFAFHLPFALCIIRVTTLGQEENASRASANGSGKREVGLRDETETEDENYWSS